MGPEDGLRALGCSTNPERGTGALQHNIEGEYVQWYSIAKSWSKQ